jgi:hypothetical protein
VCAYVCVNSMSTDDDDVSETFMRQRSKREIDETIEDNRVARSPSRSTD